MKYCRYCGKEIHENSSFCPYCMQNQIEKQSEIIYEKSSKKWLYIVLIIVTAIIAVIAVLYLVLNGENRKSDISIESTEATSATSTEPILTTVTASTTDFEQTTTITTTETAVSTTELVTTVTSIETTAVSVTETMSQEISFELGDYITEGKSSSQVMGYGGYEDIGGTILTIEGITDNTLNFSIALYSESGYASDTLSARDITAEIVGKTAEFQFDDMLSGKGAGKLTFENGKIHIETWGDTSNPTSIILNEYLT